jgi:glutathione S-transferase
MLKIWGRKNSINVQKVMWTVAELGVEAEPVDAGMAHGWSADRSRCTSSSPPCGQK